MRALIAFLFAISLPALAVNDQTSLSEADGYTPISPSDITILKQAAPSFPKKAIKAGHTHEECVVQFFVDVRGKVEDTQIQMGCPEVFHKTVHKTARKWKFEPHIGGPDDAAVPVTFALRFTFKRD